MSRYAKDENDNWNLIAGTGTSSDIPYDNTTSGLSATKVQDAIDEVDGNVDTNTTNITNLQNNKAEQTSIAPVQTTLVASQPYPKGSQFYYNNILYEATADIASGGTITIDGNATTADDIVSQISKSYQLDNTRNDISQYVYPNKYQTPSDGYARLICSVAGTARIVLDDTVMTNYVNAPVNTNLAIFVRKGVPISWVGSTGDTFEFFPVE